jgi:hypothetical protein
MHKINTKQATPFYIDKLQLTLRIEKYILITDRWKWSNKRNRWCSVEKGNEQGKTVPLKRISSDESIAERRARVEQFYRALPAYGSGAFWAALEDRSPGVPLEALVKALRVAVALGERENERRLFEMLFARVQTGNEQWVNRVLASMHVLAGERAALAADLSADLCETLLRELRDPRQHFWEEHFQQSLIFARRHVYERFLIYEGRWHDQRFGPGRRVPSLLISSLERATSNQGTAEELEICDERAQEALLQVEQGDIARHILCLPERLRAVVWLIFWEDHTEKTVSKLLAISERTVRNRLQAALAQLRQVLSSEQEGKCEQSA